MHVICSSGQQSRGIRLSASSTVPRNAQSQPKLQYISISATKSAAILECAVHGRKATGHRSGRVRAEGFRRFGSSLAISRRLGATFERVRRVVQHDQVERFRSFTTPHLELNMKGILSIYILSSIYRILRIIQDTPRVPTGRWLIGNLQSYPLWS
jgi:hypothetical protein